MQYRPVRTAARSPRMMAPLCTITLPCRTMFCEPHRTVCRLTLLPEAVSTYSSLLNAAFLPFLAPLVGAPVASVDTELQARAGVGPPPTTDASGAAFCHEMPVPGRVLCLAIVRGASWLSAFALDVELDSGVGGGSAGDRFLTLNLKLNDSARGVGNM
uniref:Uncharacterized protein n=1 Tax=Anopheles farauti TaxID=69004 RepID=A0A182QSG0_9DIPT